LDGFPAARLVIVGDGPEKEELQALATEKGISRQVDFVGEVPHEHLPA
ncbi:MAG: glycosyltransferase family 1 protein, partial [Chloroflexi bacterium CG_4_10_14_0_8_um_filter_57_5]